MMPKTYGELYQWLLSALSFRENAANESRWLIENHTQKSFFELGQVPCSHEDFSTLRQKTEKLKEGVPFQYVLGSQDFYGSTFAVTEDVLVPRPETELLVDTAVEWGKKKTLCALDVCTGSGCIAISLARNLRGDFFATDISEKALNIAKRNAEKNETEITFFQGDLLSAIPNTLSFHLITANPPYLSKEDMAAIPKELTYEPSLALYGGEKGLDLCNTLIQEVPKYLYSQGLFLMEFGEAQGKDILDLAKSHFSEAKICQDWNHKDRFLYAVK